MSLEEDQDVEIDKPCETNVEQKKKENLVKEVSPGRKLLHSWLNRNFRIVMTDGRILIGVFLCTDADANVILGMCSEFMEEGGEKRSLGLVMVPGRHIVSMEVDISSNPPPSQPPTAPNYGNENESDTF